MALQDIVRLILPKEDHFYDFLEEQAKLAHEGAKALQQLSKGNCEQVKEDVHDVEKRGDEIAHDVEDALAKTFVTPIDREDIHRLSALLDDILDGAYATASAFVMFSIESPSEHAANFMDLLVETTEKLAAMMPELRGHSWDEIRKATREMKLLEKRGDEIYRTAMKQLFSNDRSGGPYRDMANDARALIREKEVLELLENAVDTCEDVAEYLTNLAVKHG